MGDAESFATGGHNLDRCRGREDCLDQIGGGIQHVFAVVEHQQPHPALQGGGHALGHAEAGLLGDAQHRGHRVGHRSGIVDRGQLEKPHPVGKLIDQPPRDFERQPGLADPTHPGQRDQPMTLHRGLHLAGLDLTSDEACGHGPQVPRTRIQRPQRRKVGAQAIRLDLEHPESGSGRSRNRRGPKSIRSTPLSRPAVESANRI